MDPAENAVQEANGSPSAKCPKPADDAAKRFEEDMAGRTGEFSEMALQYGLEALRMAEGKDIHP